MAWDWISSSEVKQSTLTENQATQDDPRPAFHMLIRKQRIIRNSTWVTQDDPRPTLQWEEVSITRHQKTFPIPGRHENPRLQRLLNNNVQGTKGIQEEKNHRWIVGQPRIPCTQKWACLQRSVRNLTGGYPDDPRPAFTLKNYTSRCVRRGEGLQKYQAPK